MKQFVLLFVCFFMFFGTIVSQKLVSVTYKGTRTKQQITTMFGLQFVKYGAKYYAVNYISPDAKGNQDTLSGLMVVPDDLSFEFPRLVYQHGTSDCKTCVPSRYGNSGGEEGQLGLLFAGLGFVTILPDYVGMGDGRGFQTYVHGATTVSASVDMLTACAEWSATNSVFTNDQLFVTGYSQGGYASMALHKYLEETQGPISITAAAHLSGPYSLSGVMRDLILGDVPYFYPAYVPNTVLGFNEVNENLFSDLNEFFKAEYVADIKRYYDGVISLTSLNIKLIQLLQSNTGASVGGRMIRDDVKEEIKNNPLHPANLILKENDVFDWAPQIPTRIFYCKADDQVPYLNSIVAKDTMSANGAPNLMVTDVSPSSNHGQCVTPAITNTVLFFLSLQRITSSVKETNGLNSINIYPNPVSDLLMIEGLSGNETIAITNNQGQVVTQRQVLGSEIANFDFSNLPVGLYFISIHSESGKTIKTQKVIKSLD